MMIRDQIVWSDDSLSPNQQKMGWIGKKPREFGFSGLPVGLVLRLEPSTNIVARLVQASVHPLLVEALIMHLLRVASEQRDFGSYESTIKRSSCLQKVIP